MQRPAMCVPKHGNLESAERQHEGRAGQGRGAGQQRHRARDGRGRNKRGHADHREAAVFDLRDALSGELLRAQPLGEARGVPELFLRRGKSRRRGSAAGGERGTGYTGHEQGRSGSGVGGGRALG